MGGTRKAEIGDRMVKRLSLYLRLLHELRARHELYASGAAIAKTLGLDSIVVRKDLARSGVRGTPRRGFPVAALIAAIEQFLGWNTESQAVLAGVGRLGSALLDFPGFHHHGLRIVAAFDDDPRRIGRKNAGVPVYATREMADIVRKLAVVLGILTVPPEAAQSVADAMVAGGIRGIWNFTTVQLVVPAGVTVKREDLAAGLAVLSHRLRAESRAG
jgi:redox-sensing transcriptional repressor